MPVLLYPINKRVRIESKDDKIGFADKVGLNVCCTVVNNTVFLHLTLKMQYFHVINSEFSKK